MAAKFVMKAPNIEASLCYAFFGRALILHFYDVLGQVGKRASIVLNRVEGIIFRPCIEKQEILWFFILIENINVRLGLPPRQFFQYILTQGCIRPPRFYLFMLLG